MCGITAIYSKSGLSSGYVRKANSITAHRGPDDEGYLLWRPEDPLQVLSGEDTPESTLQAYRYPRLAEDRMDWKIGLGHRRLSILDVSPNGHQPMVLPSRGLVIAYNGEVYNYIEVRSDLQKLGHQFHTGSDTEVILHAWAEWGKSSMDRFNGMFAFVLLDTQQQKLYAVRDRFGVKPLYYTDRSGYVAFASEVKQLRELPSYNFKLNSQIAYDYLRHSLIDHSEETFEENIYQIKPGHFIELNVATGMWTKTKWYTLTPQSWRGNETDACDHLYDLLEDSVRLRMRSDVPIGSALSGGLDSSTIVCLMREVLQNQGSGGHLIKTITSCHEDKKYDEWDYARVVIRHAKAQSYQVFPSFEKLQQDFERMLWHMDYPFGSTSQFSQWCVFEEAKKQGLTVMIDGQGADEQLAGYGGNDIALYSGLIGAKKFLKGWKEARSYRQQKGKWPVGFLLGAIQINYPWLNSIFPKRYKVLPRAQLAPGWLKAVNFKENVFVPKSLRANLSHQVQELPLPSLLRYEDRNSMAFSVESRVPFMDYRLLEFTLGLPENLIYREGERKYILRKTFRGLVPDKILDRTDKMGFVSAEERWIKEDGKDWFYKNMKESVLNMPDFFNLRETIQYLEGVQNNSNEFSFDPWRILCLGFWFKQMTTLPKLQVK